MGSTVHVLLVDDQPNNLLALKGILASPRYTMFTASSGAEMLSAVLQYEVDIIVLDVYMPGMGGFAVANILQSQERTRDIPILFVTAMAGDAAHAAQAYALGAVDYLVKPLDANLVRSKLAVFANQIELKRKVRAQEAALREAQKRSYEQQMASVRVASDARYRKLIEGIGHAIDWSAEAGTWRLTFVSQRAEKILGFTLAQLSTPDFWTRHVPAEDARALLAMFETALQGGNDRACEHRLLDAVGGLRWFHTGVSVSSAGGNMLHGVSVEVTDLKKAEQQQRLLAKVAAQTVDLCSSRHTLVNLAELLVPQLGDWCVIDEVSGPLTVVQAGAAHHDLAKQALLQSLAHPRRLHHLGTCDLAHVLESGRGKLIRSVGDPQRVSEALGLPPSLAMQGVGATSCMMVPLIARQQTLGVATLVASDSGRQFDENDLHLASEVCARVALVIDNAALYQEAATAKRARERLLAVVTHDLRNPLCGLQTNASQLVRRPGSEPERIKRIAGRIIQAAQHMDQLIGDLMDFTLLQSGALVVHPKSVCVVDLMEEIQELLHPLAEKKNQELAFSSEPTLWVACDFKRALQILSNLTGNAIKFTPDGGRIEVQAQAADADEALLCVAGTGPGIPENLFPRLFDSFWQAEQNKGTGMGLGLNIAKNLIEAHHGDFGEYDGRARTSADRSRWPNGWVL